MSKDPGAEVSRVKAEVARIEAERAMLPKDERQFLEAGDAPLLRIQLLHMLERTLKAEATITRVESYAHELRHKDAMGLLATLDGQAAEPGQHVYLSTGCRHGEHSYCQTHTGLSGAKTPAVCKFCKAPCQCPCHAKEQQ